MKSRRLFLAIPVPAALIAFINSQKEKLDLPLHWIPDQNLHVTLHFFGNVGEPGFHELKTILQKTIQPFSSFSMEAESILSKHGKDRSMLWVGFKKNSNFEALAYAVSESTGGASRRKLLPHINLARTKYPVRSPMLPLLFQCSMPLKVKHLEVWESSLGPDGPTYFALESFTLKGSIYEEER